MTLIAGRSSSRAPLVHAERRPFLVQRGEIVRALRAHFAELDFVEVETSALQVSPGNETHVHALRTELISPGDKRDRRYLRFIVQVIKFTIILLMVVMAFLFFERFGTA